MLRVLLADDNPRVRHAVRLLFEQTGVADIIAEVEHMAHLQEWLATLPILPDVILFDWELPGFLGYNGTNPTTFLHAIKQATGATLIAWSSHPGAARDALEAGADLFVSKGEPSDKLIRVLEQIATERSDEEPA